MYLLNKVVGFVISPLGIAMLGGLAALLCARLGRTSVARRVGLLSVVWLWFWMTPVAALIMMV